MLSFPKDNSSFSWTRHIKNKMVFYHLSGAQILRIFRKPDRREEGIAPQTVAAMISRKPARSSRLTANRQIGAHPSGNKPSAIGGKHHEELWIMYKLSNASRKTLNAPRTKEISDPKRAAYGVQRNHHDARVVMISAWRYPGVTKAGERPVIPEDVIEELEKNSY